MLLDLKKLMVVMKTGMYYVASGNKRGDYIISRFCVLIATCSVSYCCTDSNEGYGQYSPADTVHWSSGCRQALVSTPRANSAGELHPGTSRSRV